MKYWSLGEWLLYGFLAVLILYAIAGLFLPLAVYSIRVIWAWALA